MSSENVPAPNENAVRFEDLRETLNAVVRYRREGEKLLLDLYAVTLHEIEKELSSIEVDYKKLEKRDFSELEHRIEQYIIEQDAEKKRVLERVTNSLTLAAIRKRLDECEVARIIKDI